MISKIDLFSPPASQYQSLHYMTEKLAEALIKQGVECRLFDSKSAEEPKEMVNSILKQSPDCTLSFNGLLPDDNGNFFCDYLSIPHVSFLVDSPNHFLPLVKSPLTVISTVDLFFSEFYKGFKFDRSFFVPHGADPELKTAPSTERTFDVTMLSTFIDPYALRDEWKDKYSQEMIDAIVKASEITLSDQKTSYIEAFVSVLNEFVGESRIDPKEIRFEDTLTDLEDYIRGIDRIELLKGIDGGQLHIFGKGNWKKIEKELSTDVTFHDAVSFSEAIEVMKNSKIVLNSSPTIKQGGHIRIFTSILCGALCLTSENPFMMAHFDDDVEIATYQHGKWGKAGEKVQTYLSREEKRQEVVQEGQKEVLADFTWDHAARKLLDEASPIIDEINKTVAKNR